MAVPVSSGSVTFRGVDIQIEDGGALVRFVSKYIGVTIPNFGADREIIDNLNRVIRGQPMNTQAANVRAAVERAVQGLVTPPQGAPRITLVDASQEPAGHVNQDRDVGEDTRRYPGIRSTNPQSASATWEEEKGSPHQMDAAYLEKVKALNENKKLKFRTREDFRRGLDDFYKDSYSTNAGLLHIVTTGNADYQERTVKTLTDYIRVYDKEITPEAIIYCLMYIVVRGHLTVTRFFIDNLFTFAKITEEGLTLAKNIAEEEGAKAGDFVRTVAFSTVINGDKVSKSRSIGEALKAAAAKGDLREVEAFMHDFDQFRYIRNESWQDALQLAEEAHHLSIAELIQQIPAIHVPAQGERQWDSFFIYAAKNKYHGVIKHVIQSEDSLEQVGRKAMGLCTGQKTG